MRGDAAGLEGVGQLRGEDDRAVVVAAIDPRGLLSPQQLEVLRAEATPDGPPLTIFTHYPAIRLNSPWMDANMLIYNGEAMHQALLPARERLLVLEPVHGRQ